MKAYNVRIDLTGEELAVIARSMDHAAEVFVTFWISRAGSVPGKFDVGSGPPLHMQNNVTIQILEAGDVAGIVISLEDGRTTFEPATS